MVVTTSIEISFFKPDRQTMNRDEPRENGFASEFKTLEERILEKIPYRPDVLAPATIWTSRRHPLRTIRLLRREFNSNPLVMKSRVDLDRFKMTGRFRIICPFFKKTDNVYFEIRFFRCNDKNLFVTTFNLIRGCMVCFRLFYDMTTTKLRSAKCAALYKNGD